jgi:hypothetical protein
MISTLFYEHNELPVIVRFLLQRFFGRFLPQNDNQVSAFAKTEESILNERKNRVPCISVANAGAYH